MQFIIPSIGIFLIIMFLAYYRKERDLFEAFSCACATTFIIVGLSTLVCLAVHVQLDLMSK